MDYSSEFWLRRDYKKNLIDEDYQKLSETFKTTMLDALYSCTRKIQKDIGELRLYLDYVIDQLKSMIVKEVFEKIKSMIPGLSGLSAKIPENLLESQEAKISKWEHIIKSMTLEERENPELLEKQTSRIARIAQGAGVHGSDIRALLKQYKLLNEMIKSGKGGLGGIGDMSHGFNQKQLQKLAKKFGKVKGMRF